MLINCVDSDEIRQHVPYHRDLHRLLRRKQNPGSVRCWKFLQVTCDPSIFIDPFHCEYLQTGTWANGEDPDEMPHNAAFHQCLHSLQRYEQIRIEMLHIK